MQKESEFIMDTNNAPLKQPRKICALQMVLTAAIIVGTIAAYYLSDTDGYIAQFLCLLCLCAPFAVYVILCVKFRGIPGFLCNKAGGVILLALLLVFLVFVPTISGWLFALLSIWAGLTLFKIIGHVPMEGYAYHTEDVVIERADGSREVERVMIDHWSDETSKEQTDRQLRKSGYGYGTHWRKK